MYVYNIYIYMYVCKMYVFYMFDITIMKSSNSASFHLPNHRFFNTEAGTPAPFSTMISGGRFSSGRGDFRQGTQMVNVYRTNWKITMPFMVKLWRITMFHAKTNIIWNITML